MKKLLSSLFALFFINSPVHAGENVCNQPIDLVFALDVSGSIYAAGGGGSFTLWQQEVAFAQAIAAQHTIAESSTHVAVVASSGCVNADLTYEECVANGKFIEHLALSDDETTVMNLLDYGSSNTPAGLNDDDLIRGTSWTDERLGLANLQFESSNHVSSRKVIMLFSDSEPSSASHAMCTEEGMVSATLQSVRNDNTDLFVVNLYDAIDDFCAVNHEDDFIVPDSFDGTHYFNRILENRDGDLLCGDSDPDSDNDGVLNAADRCPAGVLGLGDAPDGLDLDSDGCVSSEDDDDDGDNILDAVDPDDDNDGIADIEDVYSTIPIGELSDNDNDGAPDNCVAVDCLGMVADDDDDNDGISDESDAFPFISIGELNDTDGDGAPDSCVEVDCLGMVADDDDDNDGIQDEHDANPLIAIGELSDTDGDGAPDNCDAVDCLGMVADDDDDNDGINDEQDSNPLVSIDGFIDTDGDGAPDNCDAVDCLGMAADTDDDNDGIADDTDLNPLIAIGELSDTDGDGAPDNCDGVDCLGMVADDDDDNDGITDENDANPLISIMGLTDEDGDGAPDNCQQEDCLGMEQDAFTQDPRRSLPSQGSDSGGSLSAWMFILMCLLMGRVFSSRRDFIK